MSSATTTPPHQNPLVLWLVTISLVALSLGALSFLTYQRDYARSLNTADDTARSYKSITRHIFEDLDRTISPLADLYLRASDQTLHAPLESLMREQKRANPVIMDLLVLDADGTILSWTGEGAPPDVREREYYRHHLSDQAAAWHLSTPRRSLVHPDAWFVGLSRAIREDDGNLLGVAVAVVSLSGLQRHYENFLDHGTLALALLMQDGALLLRVPSTDIDPGADLRDLAEVRLPLEHAFTLEVPRALDGQRRIASVHPLEDLPLIVASSVNLHRSLDLWRFTAFAAFAFWLLLIGGGFVVALRLRAAQRREQSMQATFESITRNLPGFVYQLRREPDGRFRYVYASQGMQRLLGVTPQQALDDADSLLGLIHPDDIERVIAESLEHAERLAPWHSCFRMVRPQDGRTYWIEAYDTPQHLPDGAILWTGYANDVTEQRDLEETLRQRETTFRMFVENANDIIYALTPEGVLTYVSPNWSEILGHDIKEVTGHSIGEFIHPEDLPRCRAYLQDIVRTGRKGSSIEYRVRHRNGEWRWHTSNGAPIFDGEGHVESFIGIARDVTERKLDEARILHLAHYDTLTDLPNRALFFEMVEHALNVARRDNAHIALMFVDLDRFKPVNDEFGHAVGDVLLQQVARRLSASLRESDIAARIGGDEFVVLLHRPETEEDALRVADKILEQLRLPFNVEGHELHISASIGIALYPEHGDDSTLLAQRADQAMYRAKAAGRDTAKVYRPPELPGAD